MEEVRSGIREVQKLGSIKRLYFSASKPQNSDQIPHIQSRRKGGKLFGYGFGDLSFPQNGRTTIAVCGSESSSSYGRSEEVLFKASGAKGPSYKGHSEKPVAIGSGAHQQRLDVGVEKLLAPKSHFQSVSQIFRCVQAAKEEFLVLKKLL